ncbi:MAG: UDP-3-O-(3-hydroxymyristoyl)glucosamine N-acyltransferase [Betaproteobacteria bacterium]|nr:UDP-3-O-(3-hydroxymyristoyl)glucosamine N-acyltransferase [Betaproteobacteria bacterium]
MNPLAKSTRLGDLVALVQGQLERGNPDTAILRLATLESADGASLAFLTSGGYRRQAGITRAAAVVSSVELSEAVPEHVALVTVRDAYRAYGALARHFSLLANLAAVPSIHPTAIIDPSATLGADVAIGPHVSVAADVQIGAGAMIGAGCTLDHAVRIGAQARLYPRVTVGAQCDIGARSLIHSGTVVGSDGFGFARHEQRWEKIPQLGSVRIGDDVEIGANCAIDRGALDDTVIGDGCKLDNLIQVAHNVRIGEHTAIAACVGIAGSARIGRRCMIGGAAGILGHLEICDDVTISAMSLVTRSITQPGFYSGIFPLMDNSEWERAAVLVRHLPELRARLRRLESRLKES